MPVITIEHPFAEAPAGLLETICERVQALLLLPENHVWAFWHCVPMANAYRPDWRDGAEVAGPIVRIRCKSKYSDEERRTVMHAVADEISRKLSVPIDSIFVLLDPVEPGRILSRGTIWEGE